jgi:GTP-binding protein Era
METAPINPDYRAGIVAIVGRANVGKSTLINRILGEKVSITSPVAQTTRNAIRAIHTEERGQLVFLDTPGVHKAKHDLGKVMNKTARSATEGADVCILVLDSTRVPREEDDGWMRRLAKSQSELVFVLNKQDSSDEKKDMRFFDLWTEIAEENACELSPKWLKISAETGKGINRLTTALFDRVPLGPPLFDDDLLTDFPRQLAISDVIREKLFYVLKDELPHAIAVNVTKLDESETEWKVEATILVNRSSQKGIVIGEKGRLLKRITQTAQKELSAMFDIRVRLRLWVKVEKNWAQNVSTLKQLGYIQ